MPKKIASPLDEHRDEIEVLVGSVGLTEVASELRRLHGIKTTRHSVRRALRRWGVSLPQERAERPGVEIQGEKALVTGKPERKSNSGNGTRVDPDTLLKERGLEPDEWEVERIKVNEWDALAPEGETITLYQLTVTVRRKRPFKLVIPANEPSYQHVHIGGSSTAKGESELWVFMGDQQAPYHDERLHELACRWLDKVQPNRGVFNGDTLDLPDISRHPENPEWHVSAQKCIDGGYGVLRDAVQSSTHTRWQKLCGNHDERIRIRLLNYQTKLYDLKPADLGNDTQQRPVWHIANLLHLDSLGIEYIEPNGHYDHAQVKVSPFLAARHGWLARKGSGASALATLQHLGYSVLVGHTHRQSRVHQTVHNIDGKPYTLTAVETGCMCRVEDGLGYTVAPDWQNGFATAQVWADGTFNIDLATYVDDKLFWRNERFE